MNQSRQLLLRLHTDWGLRKYKGNQDLIWGGDKDCKHEWITESKSMEYIQGNPEFARPHREQKNFIAQTNTCSLCGAWRGAFGLESTPDCGRPFMTLKGDLTEKEIEYVMGELKKCGLI